MGCKTYCINEESLPLETWKRNLVNEGKGDVLDQFGKTGKTAAIKRTIKLGDVFNVRRIRQNRVHTKDMCVRGEVCGWVCARIHAIALLLKNCKLVLKCSIKMTLYCSKRTKFSLVLIQFTKSCLVNKTMFQKFKFISYTCLLSNNNLRRPVSKEMMQTREN